MRSNAPGSRIHFVERGDGVPLVALHGAGVDHRDVEAAVEFALLALRGVRRIYVDLPAMGATPGDGLTSNDDVVNELGAFIGQLDAGPVLLLGHSYGAYLARGVAAKYPDAVSGLALICPVGDTWEATPAHSVVREDHDAHDVLDEAQRTGFDEYFVVRAAATARRYLDSVWPGTQRVDQPALERILGGWSIDLAGAAFAGPALILAGRNDSIAGYSHASALLDSYPRATLAVIDGVGHALLHERPELVRPLIGDWVERALGVSG